MRTAVYTATIGARTSLRLAILCSPYNFIEDKTWFSSTFLVTAPEEFHEELSRRINVINTVTRTISFRKQKTAKAVREAVDMGLRIENLEEGIFFNNKMRVSGLSSEVDGLEYYIKTFA